LARPTRDAKAKGTRRGPAEKSGQEEFDFEYGEDSQNIEVFQPTFSKVLGMRYNQRASDVTAGSQQAEAAFGYLHRDESRSQFRLSSSSTRKISSIAQSDKKAYDLELRHD